MKCILVPVDFSNRATYAAKVAAQIALITQSELHLLHIINVPLGIVDPVSAGTSAKKIMYIKKAQERFKKFKKLPFFNDVEVKDFVQYYNSSNGIIEESIKHKADLIVMGSNGASGIEEILIGSNTEKVVRNSKVPVLVVKNEIDAFNIKNVVFASDFNPKVKKTFQKIIDFAGTFEATLHLVRINTIQNFETSKKSEKIIDDFIKGFKLYEHKISIYNDVTVETGVLNYAKKVNADIIAINTHGRKGLAYLFSGSISTDLSNHAKLPVITFKI